MRDPFATETRIRENVGMWNTASLNDELPGFEVPPEIRIGYWLCCSREDEQQQNKDEESSTGA